METWSSNCDINQQSALIFLGMLFFLNAQLCTSSQQYCFNYHPGDIHACVADVGWITGHSYVVYGPLGNGATSVLFESVPTYPDPGRYWEMVERLKVNQFYGAPTAIRLLLKYDDHYVTKYNRSSLKVLGTGKLFLIFFCL